MGRPRITDKRICSACDSTTTVIRKTKLGTLYECWRYHDGFVLCERCYCRYIDNPKNNPRNNKKWNPINKYRRIRFKDKVVSLKKNPREGICKLCGKKKGIDCKKTNMHHLEYHEDDPLKDTIEICVSCHTKESWRIRKEKRF